MKITIDLPEYDYSRYPSYEPDGSPSGNPPCAGCGSELNGNTARLHPIGQLHADPDEDGDGLSCLQKAVDRLQHPDLSGQSRYIASWLTVAEHVAKAPSRHSASTIRAVITNLGRIAGWTPR